MQETTATTLAARIFRFLIALITAFGLEMRQYDIVNTYIHANVDELVYRHHPNRFHFLGVLKLIRAMYGLRQSPALW